MNNPRRVQRHLVKAFAAGALLVAAALPLAFATAAGAADAITGVTFNALVGDGFQAYFGTGATGNFDVAGTVAGDGGNATVTSNAPGLTFVVTGNTTGTDLTGTFASTAATVPGTYNITEVDNSGTATLDGAFTVYPDPVVSSALTPTSTSSLADTAVPAATVITISGAGFIADGVAADPVATFTSTVDGTTLTTGAPTIAASTETTPVTSFTVPVTPTNSVLGTPATIGTYTVTVTNADGGSFTSGPIFSIVGNELTVVSPSAVGNATATTSLTITGSGFESGATVAFDGGACTGATLGTPVVTSGTTISDSVAIAGLPAASRCSLLVTNAGAGDNGASFEGVNAFAVGEGSFLPPVITASSLTTATALFAGAPSTTIALTGEGFSPYSTPVASSFGAANTADAALTIATPCIANSAGTSLTCGIAIPNNEVAGPHTANIENNSGTAASTGSLANSFTADGPAITAAAPPAIATDAPIGTVVALTGTEFNNTSTGTLYGPAGPPAVPGGPLTGTFQYVSATSMDFVVTHTPTIADNGDTLQIKSTDAYGDSELSIPFALGVDNAPTLTNIKYPTGTTGVGVGATGQTVTFTGTGFQAGVTITAFTNSSAVADAAVTAKVTAINFLGTQITATIAITAPDANTIDGYTITNPDGGNVKALAVAPAGLVIDAAPTITAASPSPAVASSTNAFTLTGTGFAAGAVVTATANGTCGVATVASATSITVSCTLGAASTTASTSLVVTNLDGGSATSAVVLPEATPPPVVKPFFISGVHGHAVAGKTVTMTISGSGFFGSPRITSNAAGTKVGVLHDTGSLLTIRVSTKAGVHGVHTFTVTLANGKSGKKNYVVVL